MSEVKADALVVGGGLAGIVAALQLLRAGKRVALVDRDTPERFGGLALWAFGGMALVGTPLQTRAKIEDTPERALADWLRFGELAAQDHWPLQWARHYVQYSRVQVYDWLLGHGLKFMPAVQLVERGRHGDGNSVPRYHIVWGTSRHLTRTLIAALLAADQGRLTRLHRHRQHRQSSFAGERDVARKPDHDVDRKAAGPAEIDRLLIPQHPLDCQRSLCRHRSGPRQQHTSVNCERARTGERRLCRQLQRGRRGRSRDRQRVDQHIEHLKIQT